ncbi:MAG: Pvc16 family protein [Cyanobium sp.]
MIGTTLEFLQRHLNDSLQLLFEGSIDGGTSNKVVLPAMSQNATEPAVFVTGAVTMLLVNVEEERQCRPAERHHSRAGAGTDIRLSLYLLFAARFSNYGTSWNHLAAILQHFQALPVLDPQTTPLLPAGIERLVFELVTQSFSEQNDVWNALRSPHHPSLLYRARLLVLRDPTFRAPIPVTTTDSLLSHGSQA